MDEMAKSKDITVYSVYDDLILGHFGANGSATVIC